MPGLRILALTFLSMFLMPGCESDEDKEERLSEMSKEEKMDHVANLYNRYCVNCHGKNGKMGFNGAKDLTESEMTVEERMEILKNGKGAMLSFEGTLSEEELSLMARYLDQLITPDE